MKKAWVVEIDGKLTVRDAVEGNPFELFLYDIAVNYTAEVPDYVENGAVFDELKQEWVNPVIPIFEYQTPSEVKISRDISLKFTGEQIKRILTLSETDETVKNFWNTVSDKFLLTIKEDELALAEILAYLKQKNVLSQEEMDMILAGI